MAQSRISPIRALELAKINYRKFIEDYEGAKAFNYFRYTEYCLELSDSTDNGGANGGYLLRDLAMCTIQPSYKPSKSTKFLDMEMLD